MGRTPGTIFALAAVLACPAFCFGGLACDHDGPSEPCQDAGHLPYSCLCKGATLPISGAAGFARIIVDVPDAASATLVPPLTAPTISVALPITSEPVCNLLDFPPVCPLLI
jgi:hypothetical protein